MKWKSSPTELLSEKTFLVIKDDTPNLAGTGKEKRSTRPKSKSAAETGTWPPKMKRTKKLDDSPERPKTANLERPSVLDPKLRDKLDMSLLSKELFCDSLTRYHRGSYEAREHPASDGEAISGLLRRHIRHNKRRSIQHLPDVGSSLPEALATPRILRQPRIPGIREELKKIDDNNNSGSGKISPLSVLKKKKASKRSVTSDVEVFTVPSRQAPEACKACGRSDQPERLHSHPKGTTVKLKENPIFTVPLPKSVQKPVPLHFRSDRTKKIDEEAKTQTRSANSPPFSKPIPEKSVATPTSGTKTTTGLTKKGPRTITCYICAREYGTASFAIHEPICLQKWERENSSLPLSQRRPRPQRPSSNNASDWNEAAWKECQAQLLPCSKCGRTFLPERLFVHRKSCKVTAKERKQNKVEVSVKSTASSSHVSPLTFTCHTYGNNFGTKSIKIHEAQCIKRQVQNDSQFDKKKDTTKIKPTSASFTSGTSPTSGSLREIPVKRTITCYICGRDFGSTSIKIHEPQCMKRWQAENDTLPLSQRRSEPKRPETFYTSHPETGEDIIDLEAINEANWKTHLGQLIPCKHCGRTFNPDRVAIHENCCKGNR